jgi:hypothetical protein
VPGDGGLAGRLAAGWSSADPRLDAWLAEADPETPETLALAAVIAAAKGARPDLLAERCQPGVTSLACIDAELIAAGRTPRKCVAGCEGEVAAPIGMTHGGRIPVALLEIGGERVPVVLDTAADLAVLSADAVSKLGLDVDWRSTGLVTAYGERAAYPYAVAAEVGLGGARFADVPFAVLGDAKWGDEVVGVVNPLALAGSRAVTLDLADFRLILGGRPGSEARPARLELARSLHKPLVLTSVERRPARPLVIDTGAARSRLGAELRALGVPLELGPTEDVGVTRLGAALAAPTVRGEPRARAGDLAWEFERSLLENGEPSSGATWQVGGWGRIGTDVLLGRAITVDPAERTLEISKKPSFPAMPEDARRELRFEGALTGAFTLTEELVAHDGGLLHVRYAHDWHNEMRRFEARLPYGPGNLYRWGHPLRTILCETTSDGFSTWEQVGCDGLNAPFDAVELGAVRVIGGRVYEDDDGVCVEEASEGSLDGRAVKIEQTSCFGDPWIVRAATLTDAASGEVLVSFRTADRP